MKKFSTWIRILAALCVTSVCVSCSFDSSLGDVTCAEEGARDGDRVCEDGYWIAADSVQDATDSQEDAEPDTTDVGPDADAQSCEGDLERCEGECVDTDSSRQHCGGCGLACVAYGSNSIAECGGGRCTRYCVPGFRDANEDWQVENPSVNSDGCEVPCTDPTTEVCDGVDNDCDGRIDNTDTEWYRDSDGDGYGPDDSLIVQCDRPSDAYVEQGGDCNDSDDQVHPGIVETCEGGDCTFCNGRDDNCNNQVDDDCPCNGDETQSCFNFGSGTAGEGICESGQQQCEDGVWGECTGATGPENETCDNVDNDCDGTVDNGLTRTCGSSVGACTEGTETCSAGSWGSCQGNTEPTTETCDDVDNDCDGDVDEDVTRACGTNVGACTEGTETCSAGSWGSCQGNTEPTTETCDDVDNDCDGDIDEDVTRTCGTNVGACTEGTETCSAGSWGSCQGNTEPTTDTCDGVDNDCDGDIDEDYPTKGDSCTVGTGACENTGTYECNSAGDGVTCSASPGSPDPSETCGDGVDNDCDTEIDEGCTTTEICTDSMDNDGDQLNNCEDEDCDGDPCGTGVGAVCDFSNTECVETACDGVDNNQDGSIDEGCDSDGDNYCDAGMTIMAGTTECPNTTAGDASTYDCNDENSNIHPDAAEECNNVDNDCDGTADENDSDSTDYCVSQNNNSYDCYNDGGSYCCRQTGGSC